MILVIPCTQYVHVCQKSPIRYVFYENKRRDCIFTFLFRWSHIFSKRRYNVFLIFIFNVKDVHKLQFIWLFLFSCYSAKKNTENMNLKEEQTDWILIAAMCLPLNDIVFVIVIILYIRKK